MEARAEREAIREEMELIRRDEEMAQHHEWLKQEDTFHLKQARQRSRIRMKERRAKPIDHLARYVAPDDDEEEEELIDLDMQEPLYYITGLPPRDLEDLLADIHTIRKLENSDVNAAFWFAFCSSLKSILYFHSEITLILLILTLQALLKPLVEILKKGGVI